MTDLLNAPEQWSWKKFFSGFVDGKNTAKSIVLAFHLAILVFLASFTTMGVFWLKGKLCPKKAEEKAIKVDSQGGPVDASQKTEKKQFNFLNFGGTNQ